MSSVDKFDKSHDFKTLDWFDLMKEYEGKYGFTYAVSSCSGAIMVWDVSKDTEVGLFRPYQLWAFFAGLLCYKNGNDAPSATTYSDNLQQLELNGTKYKLKENHLTALEKRCYIGYIATSQYFGNDY